MPDYRPAANVFYDISHPMRRSLHRLYIRKVLDEIGHFKNVFHVNGAEYTGGVEFLKFWMDIILEWEQEMPHREVRIGISAPKDVLDSLLMDPQRGPRINAMDLRYFWYRKDGSLAAIPGGKEIPGGRYFDGAQLRDRSSPLQLYRQVYEYRTKYPDKVIFHAISEDINFVIPFLMAGGSVNSIKLTYENNDTPHEYQAPVQTRGLQHLFQFVSSRLGGVLADMTPDPRLSGHGQKILALSSENQVLIYAIDSDQYQINFSERTGRYTGEWFNPITGVSVTLATAIAGGEKFTLSPPAGQNWLLLLEKIAN